MDARERVGLETHGAPNNATPPDILSNFVNATRYSARVSLATMLAYLGQKNKNIPFGGLGW